MTQVAVSKPLQFAYSLLFDIGTHWGNIRVILGLYWDTGKENENLYNRLCRALGGEPQEIILLRTCLVFQAVVRTENNRPCFGSP